MFFNLSEQEYSFLAGTLDTYVILLRITQELENARAFLKKKLSRISKYVSLGQVTRVLGGRVLFKDVEVSRSRKMIIPSVHRA